jgi:hypothetical protein
VKKFICLKWADKGLGDLLEQGVELVLHPVKELKKKTHSKTRYGSGYEAEEEEEEEADDYVDPNFVPQDKKGMLARMEDKLKKIFCFQSFAHKKMYKAHYNEKMARQRKIVMMRHIAMETKSGSENCITPEEKWIPKECQWDYVDTKFVVDPTAPGTSRAIKYPLLPVEMR